MNVIFIISYITERYCGKTPQISFANVVNTTSVEVGGLAYYQCYDGYASSGEDEVTCQSDGRWKISLECTGQYKLLNNMFYFDSLSRKVIT